MRLLPEVCMVGFWETLEWKDLAKEFGFTELTSRRIWRTCQQTHVWWRPSPSASNAWSNEKVSTPRTASRLKGAAPMVTRNDVRDIASAIQEEA